MGREMALWLGYGSAFLVLVVPLIGFSYSLLVNDNIVFLHTPSQSTIANSKKFMLRNMSRCDNLQSICVT
jgi:hypothetical protein